MKNEENKMQNGINTGVEAPYAVRRWWWRSARGEVRPPPGVRRQSTWHKAARRPQGGARPLAFGEVGDHEDRLYTAIEIQTERFTMTCKTVLTGDRPTGRMHLGHYVGSLKNRFALQETHRCFYMIADYQALTTHEDRAREIEGNVREIVLDYLTAGFDPERSVCFLQSQVPQLAELTMIFSNLVTLPRLLRNPTIREEMQEMGKSERTTYGFVGYPVSQAADILLFRPELVPVGPDQRPHIELAQEVAARFNRDYGEVFPIPEGVYGERLVGTDGTRKMGKSFGNAIFLSDAPEAVQGKVAEMVTDPARVRLNDPGHPEVCSVYNYHLMLDPDAETAVA